MEKTWAKPKLIVLFRGRPEERVLTCCKNGTTGGVSDVTQDQGNCEQPIFTNSCPDCQSITCS